MRNIALVTFLTALCVHGKPSNKYIVDVASGKAYKLMYHSRTWNAAKEVCEREGAKLAVPKTEADFNFIQKLVRGMYYPDITGTAYKQLVWVGINNLENYQVWKDVDGENINNSGYHIFSGNNGKAFSDDPAEPHCVGIDPINPGLRDWWCHRQQPYVCEKKASKCV